MTQQDNNFPEDNEEVVILLEDDDIVAGDEVPTVGGYEADTEPVYAEEGNMVPEEALGTEIVYEEDAYEEAPRLADPINDMDEKYDDSDEPGFMRFFNGKGVIIAGIALAVLILVAGVVLLLKKAPKEEPVDLSTLGNAVAAIGNIGEANIKAITEAQSVRLEEINEAVKDYDYGEADLENGITAVNLSLTTILKDLKIKFTNSKNKLIAKVPFKVEVTDPSGKTVTWVDEDKDGIIYESDLEGGTYNVKLISLDGYDTMYDFTVNPAKSIAVKTQLDYQKVDVTNEIKKSSQASEKDDKATHDTAVESALKDTVAYVISAKVANSNGYAEIDKAAKIEDPILTLTKKTEVKAPGYLVLALGRPVNTTDPGNTDPGNTDPGNTDPGTGNTDCANGAHSGTTFVSHGDDGHQYKCDSCGQPYGEVVGHNLGNATNTGDPGTHSRTCTDGCGYSTTEPHTFGDAVSVDDTNHKKTCTACGYELTEAHNNWTYTAKAGGKHEKKCGTCGYTVEETCEKGDDGNCKFCNQALTATVIVSLSIDKNVIHAGTDTALGLAHIAQITPTVKSKKGTDEQTVTEYSVTYESSDTSVLTVDQTGKITAAKTTKKGEAKATVTVTAKLSTGESGKATVEVTVKDPVVKLNYTTKKIAFIGGESLAVTATVTGHTQKDTITWKSSDTAIATVTDKCVVTGLKTGTVTITATSVENPEVFQQLSVEVMVHPKNDTTTKLVDTA
ncbi:MAG: Ig-like domain-containing protein, partial [Lachnospiraceae bacterium]|nr:Ig-like domain-containing protein [Lachnospiraceae bacterium]